MRDPAGLAVGPRARRTVGVLPLRPGLLGRADGTAGLRPRLEIGAPLAALCLRMTRAAMTDVLDVAITGVRPSHELAWQLLRVVEFHRSHHPRCPGRTAERHRRCRDPIARPRRAQRVALGSDPLSPATRSRSRVVRPSVGRAQARPHVLRPSVEAMAVVERCSEPVPPVEPRRSVVDRIDHDEPGRDRVPGDDGQAQRVGEQGLVRGSPGYPVGMVLLARLAVDQTEQGAGLGTCPGSAHPGGSRPRPGVTRISIR